MSQKLKIEILHFHSLRTVRNFLDKKFNLATFKCGGGGQHVVNQDRALNALVMDGCL